MLHAALLFVCVLLALTLCGVVPVRRWLHGVLQWPLLPYAPACFLALVALAAVTHLLWQWSSPAPVSVPVYRLALVCQVLVCGALAVWPWPSPSTA